MKSRRITLIIGLVLALGTGVLLLTYLSSLRPSTPLGDTKAYLVAVHDIPAHTEISVDMFVSQQRVISQVDSDAITDARHLVGQYTLVAIPAGSVATTARVGAASAGQLAENVPLGMLAVSFQIDSVKGVGGLLAPGDRVDVIAIPARVGNETPLGRAIIRRALVLAVGSDLSTVPPAKTLLSTSSAPPPTTVTLALTPSQADIATGADLSSTLRLALRNPRQAVRSFAVEPLRLANLTAPSVTATASVAPVQTSTIGIPSSDAAAASSGQPNTGVIVIEGDKRIVAGQTPP